MMKVNCSQIGRIMTNGRSKSEPLGETAKTLIREIWIADKYKRKKIVTAKQMTKGILCEEEILSLYTKHTGKLIVKNETRLENDWIKGYPDAFTSDAVVEVKTPYDIFSFFDAEITKDYEWQILGYMMLMGKDYGHLFYGLVNTPEELILDEQRRLWYAYNQNDEDPRYQREYAQIKANHTFDDIPANERVKMFTIERDKEKEAQMIERIEIARDYYNKLA